MKKPRYVICGLSTRDTQWGVGRSCWSAREFGDLMLAAATDVRSGAT